MSTATFTKVVNAFNNLPYGYNSVVEETLARKGQNIRDFLKAIQWAEAVGASTQAWDEYCSECLHEGGQEAALYDLFIEKEEEVKNLHTLAFF